MTDQIGRTVEVLLETRREGERSKALRRITCR